jgi:mycofactocin system FadH/OYE family oxidoreductase 2
METRYPHLFSPFHIKGVELRNRVVFLPHVTMYAGEDRRPSERLRHYYLERARGGVGLIVTESQYVYVNGGAANTVDASNREGMLAWRETIAAVHAQGAKMFAQLTHHGSQTFSHATSLPLWGPSPVSDPSVGEIPHVMGLDEIRAVIDASAGAAANACAAGFDGVELKVGHDGLLRQFLSPYWNRRDDEYGGSIEKRMRLVLETLAAVRSAIGIDMPLGLRFCLDEGIPGGYGLEDALGFARHFAATGHVDYLSADMGTWMRLDLQIPPMTWPEGYALEAAAALRAATQLPVIAFGRIKRPEQAEEALASGAADLVGLARQLIADPAWAVKAATGRATDIRPCVACNQLCVGNLARSLPIGCVHNPAAGREERLGALTLRSAKAPKRVLVVGGGPAGLKAAEVAAHRGHRVTLLERAQLLGGQVTLAATTPGHGEWGEIATHLAAEIGRLGVETCLGIDATPETVLAAAPDAVVIATGSAPAPPPFAPVEGLVVLNDLDVLRGPGPQGKSVLLLDLGVRFQGAALVEMLAARGNSVRWVTPAPFVGAEVDPSSLLDLRRRFAGLGIVCMPEHTVIATAPGTITLLNVFTGAVTQVEAETLVVAGARRAVDDLATAIRGRVPELHVVGDSVAPRTVSMAIYEGELAGRAI